ncbi:TetR/AcrR family transcriptional regulator [Pedococcus sp. 5OH_020]|uniref:TetR/AcrR family transcriptional regulator n=1 Tax=Pedococcus sp. 5OH_020 TaxID=2989814 RepID=UPI0022E9E67C|nr:TetR/AcrR family transcriptional regulator [Pedococcus sp. 5OH_020]
MRTSTDGRSTRWDQHRTTRRRELVDATLRAIRKHGAAVGMDDIAATAGTSKTVFYRHFTDRTGLYAAVSDSVDARILRDLGLALGAAADDLTTVTSSPRALIAAAIAAYLTLVDKDPEVYRFVVNAPLLDRHTGGDPAAPVTSHIAEQMSALVAQALAAAGRDPEAASVWGPGLVGMVRAAADQWLAAPRTMTLDQLTEHLTDLAWSGLSAAWPARS